MENSQFFINILYAIVFQINVTYLTMNFSKHILSILNAYITKLGYVDEDRTDNCVE